MATRDDGNTDRMLDVELLCKLSGMLREAEFENLKEVISMACDIPQNVIEKCNTFTTFWTNLKKLGMIRVGEYGILVKYLELLNRKDCASVIRDYTTKIEGLICQPGPTKQPDEPSKPSSLQKLKGMIISKFQKKEIHTNPPTLPSSSAMGSSPLPSPETSRQTEELSEPLNRQMVEEMIHSKLQGLNKNQNPAQTSQATCVFRAPASADINKLDSHGETALHKATREGDTGLVKTLLQQGANPDKPEEIGCTALITASWYGYNEIVAALIENNTDVNLQSKFGVTALLSASSSGHKDVIATLLENNADLNLQNKDGRTALMSASWYGHKEAVAVLLENNADVNLQSKDGRTALSIAKTKTRNEITKMLMAAGAKR